MRIAIANWTARHVGGAESYLEVTIPALMRVGHEISYLYELEKPADRAPLNLPAGMPLWCASEIGEQTALASLREWKPDIVYAHCPKDAALERETVAAAPSVFFVHDYHGACISGDKMFKLPRYQPCSRTFGWPCLLKYYPRRCGGRSPISMMRMFRVQAGRLAALRQYDRIITASEHMRREYLRHGFAAESVRTVIPPVKTYSPGRGEPEFTPHPTAGWRLVFAGRMTHLKGGPILIDALPRVSAALDSPISLTFVGDGQARPEWEARARAVMARNRDLYIEFTGWLSGVEFDSVVRRSHLHVMPSVWPEPFGRSGPELGARGLPSAAFAVGGIPEWLSDGVNGFLASADPPTSEGLADAIARCLADGETYARLRAGAIESTDRFGLERHLEELTRVFGEAAEHRRHV